MRTFKVQPKSKVKAAEDFEYVRDRRMIEDDFDVIGTSFIKNLSNYLNGTYSLDRVSDEDLQHVCDSLDALIKDFRSHGLDEFL